MQYGCFEDHEPITSLRHSNCPLKAATFRGTPLSGTEEAHQLRMAYDPGVAPMPQTARVADSRCNKAELGRCDWLRQTRVTRNAPYSHSMVAGGLLDTS